MLMDLVFVLKWVKFHLSVQIPLYRNLKAFNGLPKIICN